MDTKLSKLKAFAASGDWVAAIRVAARFPQLGAQRGAILDAHLAITNPRFCLAIKKQPDTLVAAGIAALRVRYGI